MGSSVVLGLKLTYTLHILLCVWGGQAKFSEPKCQQHGFRAY